MQESPIHRCETVLGGTPVFRGTRVPVDALFDSLAAGDRLDEFLAGFPTVSRDQAVGVLELVREAVRSRRLFPKDVS